MLKNEYEVDAAGVIDLDSHNPVQNKWQVIAFCQDIMGQTFAHQADR